jgi:hypothetical protein
VSAHVLVQRLQAIENSQAMEKHNQSKRKATDPSQHKVSVYCGFIIKDSSNIFIHLNRQCMPISFSL